MFDHLYGWYFPHFGHSNSHSRMSVVSNFLWVSSFPIPPCERKMHLPSHPKAVTRASACCMCPFGHCQVSSPMSQRIERLWRLLLAWAPRTQRVIPFEKKTVCVFFLCLSAGKSFFTASHSEKSLCNLASAWSFASASVCESHRHGPGKFATM